MEARLLHKAGTRGIKYKDTPDAWQTAVHDQFILPFPLPWLLISLAIFCVCYIIPYYSGEKEDFSRLFAVECFIIAALTNAVVFFERMMDYAADNYPLLLDEDQKTADRWIIKWYERMFWSRKNKVMGLIFAIMIPVVYESCNVTKFEHTASMVCAVAISMMLGFAAGSYFWIMICIARMFKSLGRDVKIRPSIFDGKTSVLRGASAIIFKVSLISMSIYLLGISTPLVCEYKQTAFEWAFTAAFGLYILLYYVISQWGIHKSLLEIKQARLNALVEQIDNTYNVVASEASREAIEKLDKLLNLQGVVNGKQVWSFGTKELLTLISSILLPTIFFLFKR